MPLGYEPAYATRGVRHLGVAYAGPPYPDVMFGEDNWGRGDKAVCARAYFQGIYVVVVL